MLHKAFPSALTEASRKPHFWSEFPEIRLGGVFNKVFDGIFSLIPSAGAITNLLIAVLITIAISLGIYAFFWIDKVFNSRLEKQKSFDTQIEEYVVPLQAQIDDLHNEVVELREQANMAPYAKYLKHAGKVKHEIKKNGKTIGWEWK